MSAYPIAYDQTPPLKRNRLTVFFRFLMIIPLYIWSIIYAFGAMVVVFIAWFALLFTGRYPAGMYGFIAGYLRFLARYNAYTYLIVDQYPPFDGGEHAEYPVRATVGPPQPKYSRLKVFFRFILAIPIFIMVYVFGLWLLAVAVAIWFVAVIMGKTSPGLTEAMRFPMSYLIRSSGYLLLLTDRYPPLSETETLPHLSQPPPPPPPSTPPPPPPPPPRA